MITKEEELLQAIGQEIVDSAITFAPVRSGNLRDDIRVFDDDISNLEITVGNSASIGYAVFVHDGTGKYWNGKNRGLSYTRKSKRKIEQKSQPYLDTGLAEVLSSNKIDKLLSEYSDDISEEFYQNIKRAFESVSTS